MSVPADEALLAAAPSRAPGTELHWDRDGTHYAAIVKCRRHGRYHRLSHTSAWIWSLCDGQRTVAAIAGHITAHRKRVDAEKVLVSVRRLAAHGLVNGVAVETPPAQARTRGGFGTYCHRLLTWRMTIRRVDPFLSWLYEHIGRLAFLGPARVLLVALMAGGFISFVTLWLSQPRAFAVTPGRWNWFLPLFFYGCVLLHETAHAMATKHFGREIISIGFGWFWVGPFFYVDTTDIWLANRRARILVSLAGTMSDLAIAGICMIVAFAVTPARAAACDLAACLYLIVLGNLSPLLEYDGYYALADFLHRPNLRRQSFMLLASILRRRPIQWRDLGHDRIASAYAVGSLIYMVFLLAMSVRFNQMLLAGLLRGMPVWWSVALSWLITLGLLLILISGLLGDLRRLVGLQHGHPSRNTR